MGKLAIGYGSEWHLLRFLGRHRDFLNSKILNETKGNSIKWLDFPFSTDSEYFDLEWTGLQFIQDEQIQSSWKSFWPTTGTAQNWDAVGKIHYEGAQEWLLVEAKAHLDEIKSSCSAKERGGLPQIRAALNSTKTAIGAPTEADWLNGYYQFGNRLACLHFLETHGIPARLVMLYFVGNTQPGANCPNNKSEWDTAISKQNEHLGLNPTHSLSNRVHKIFIDVAGRPL